MSTITAQQDLFASLGLSGAQNAEESRNDASQLGMDTFLKLMVTQLNHQDPFKPMENGEFLGQIAQFGSVSGLDKLNQSFAELSTSLTSGQALQAGALVGHEILAPIETGHLAAGNSIRGQVEIPANTPQVVLRVTDGVGQLVREMPLGAADAGSLDFAWDGLRDDGSYAAPGRYTLNVQSMQDGRAVDLQTQLFATVESVNLGGANGLTLNLAGLGPISFNNVKQIH